MLLRVGGSGISLLGYLFSFEDILIWKAPPCGVYGSRDSLRILQAGGVYTLAGFSVPTFSGEGLVKINILTFYTVTPQVSIALVVTRRHGNNAGCKV